VPEYDYFIFDGGFLPSKVFNSIILGTPVHVHGVVELWNKWTSDPDVEKAHHQEIEAWKSSTTLSSWREFYKFMLNNVYSEKWYGHDVLVTADDYPFASVDAVDNNADSSRSTDTNTESKSRKRKLGKLVDGKSLGCRTIANICDRYCDLVAQTDMTLMNNYNMISHLPLTIHRVCVNLSPSEVKSMSWFQLIVDTTIFYTVDYLEYDKEEDRDYENGQEEQNASQEDQDYDHDDKYKELDEEESKEEKYEEEEKENEKLAKKPVIILRQSDRLKKKERKQRRSKKIKN
jgi:hypothetical protein